MKRTRSVLLAILCCAFVSVGLTGCSTSKSDDTPGKGLSESAKKAKKGDE